MKIKQLIKVMFILLISVTSLTILASCKVSKDTKAIQGTWFAQDTSKGDRKITLTKDKLTIDDKSFTYKQTAMGTKNGIDYYGITYDKKSCSIIFPDKKNKDIAIMLDMFPNGDYLSGSMLFAMNRSDAPDYDAYFKKYLE